MEINGVQVKQADLDLPSSSLSQRVFIDVSSPAINYVVPEKSKKSNEKNKKGAIEAQNSDSSDGEICIRKASAKAKVNLGSNGESECCLLI